MRQFVLLLASGAAYAGCASAGGQEPTPQAALTGPDLVLGGWAVEPFVSEYPVESQGRGRIVLDVQAQVLRFVLREHGNDLSFDVGLRELLPQLTAVTFTQMGPGHLLLGGHDPREKTARLARVRFSPSGTSSGEIVRWHGPDFAVASGLDLFPDGQRVAILDHVSDRLFVYRDDTQRIEEIIEARGVRGLASARYVHVKPIEGPSQGTLIWATEVDEEGLALATRMGRSTRILDRDGDGVFESVE